jgi:hypothetical protein
MLDNSTDKAAVILLGAVLLFGCAAPRVTETALPESSLGTRPLLLERVLSPVPLMPDSTMGRTSPFFEYFLRATPHFPEATMGSTPLSSENFLQKDPFMPESSLGKTPSLLVPVLEPLHLPE